MLRSSKAIDVLVRDLFERNIIREYAISRISAFAVAFLLVANVAVIIPDDAVAQVNNNSIIINELELNPPGNDNFSRDGIMEQVELFNPTSDSIDVTGWTVSSTHGPKHETIIINSGTVIPAGGYLLVGQDAQWLDNEDETVILRNTANDQIDSAGSFGKPPLDDDNDAKSWQRCPDGSNSWIFKESTLGQSNGCLPPPPPPPPDTGADGQIADPGIITFSTELPLLVLDGDQNFDPLVADLLGGALTISVANSLNPTSDSETFDIIENGISTAEFAPDNLSGRVPITFVNSPADVSQDNGVLEFAPGDFGNIDNILVTYHDPLGAESQPKDIQLAASLTLTQGTVDVPSTVGQDDDFTMSLNDPDLDDKATVRDSYLLGLDGVGPFPLARGPDLLDNLATLEFALQGQPMSFSAPLQYTGVETSITSGQFTFTINMHDLLASAGVSPNDGDQITVIYHDLMGTADRTSSDTLTLNLTPPPNGANVVVDIKPGTFPNIINLKGEGVVPLAILTTEVFDAISVDPLSVEFGPSGSVEAHSRGHLEDVDGDGDLDLVLHFSLEETGISCGDTEVTLTGVTNGGNEIIGSDSIVTTGC